jgi:hypothetical protein
VQVLKHLARRGLLTNIQNIDLNQVIAMRATFSYLAMLVCALSCPPAYAAEADWTAVTLARDGSWGVATHPSQAAAIATAIRNCKSMSLAVNDCGSLLSTIRSGWSLAILCGHYNIVVSRPTLAEAEQAALFREIDLHMFYVPDLPSCRRVLTVDPAGQIVHPSVSSRPFPLTGTQ